MLKPAPILVLDEPGEGLDQHSEKALMKAILEAFRASTVIMITHKTVVLDQMDDIYRMEGGSLLSSKAC